MDILTVFATTEAVFNNHVVVRVYWRSGLHRKNAVDVRLALTCRDPQAAAEAIAIRHLLGEANIFNANRTGINLNIVVSKGAVKKMARTNSCNKAELYDYGYPLITRYKEAGISVSKDRSWFPFDGQLPHVPFINGESLRGIEKIDSKGMGKVAITRHALERYGQNCGTLDMNTAWKNLHRRLDSPLAQLTLPTNVLQHKLKKYGDKPEVWVGRDNNPLHYVFVPKNDHRVLVTLFNKDPEEQLGRFLPLLENRC